MQLNRLEKQTLLQIARDTLQQVPEPLSEDDFGKYEITPSLSENHPCFVTLLSGKKLRGCIGTFRSDRPLFQNASYYTIQAAVSDPRFENVKKIEAPAITIEMSVLGPLKPLKSISELELGRQGLLVEHQGFSGVLLAKVATEYGWNRDEFLFHTCQKADLAPENSQNYEISCFDEVSLSELDFL